MGLIGCRSCIEPSCGGCNLYKLEKALKKGYFNAMKIRGEVNICDDVKPVARGKWIGYPDCPKYPNAYAADDIVCSVCKECFNIIDNDTERFDFCPHCGADMREDDNGMD